MDEPEISGSEAIRRRLHARWKKFNLAKTASDLGTGLSRLEAFAKGEGKLSEPDMHLLRKEFYFHNTRFDPIAESWSTLRHRQGRHPSFRINGGRLRTSCRSITVIRH